MIEKKGKKIIVSADDFGISRIASASILKLVQKKVIDRVEVMISKNITQDYIQELLSSGVDIDIHFHLEKNNLDKWQDKPRAIDASVIKRISLFLFNYYFGKGTPKKVETEWENQILKYKELFGKIPDGASSHEHIHFFNPYFKIMLKLCQKHGINYIRLGEKPSGISGSRISKILDLLKQKNVSMLQKNGVDTSAFMVSFDWIDDDFDDVISSFPKDKIIEIVFHPELEEEFNFLLNSANRP
jgi:predicted glycoside hydrolase/deacetylase ChbG (UPF0249 family)